MRVIAPTVGFSPLISPFQLKGITIMADAAGLGLAISQLIKTLIELASDAKNAQHDLRDLRNELLGGLYTLRGSLDYLPWQAMARLDTLGWRQVVYDEIMSMMENDVRSQTSFAGRAIQYTTWHWDKKKVQERIQRVERMKSWLLIATTTDIA